MAGEPAIRLRYVKAPNYETMCSNELATALKGGGNPVVRMVARDNGGSYSICAIAGMKADAPGTVCTFRGHLNGGRECVSARDGDCSKDNGKPSPWD